MSAIFGSLSTGLTGFLSLAFLSKEFVYQVNTPLILNI